MVAIDDAKSVSLSVEGKSLDVCYYEEGSADQGSVIFMQTGGAGTTAYMCWHRNIDAFVDAGPWQPPAQPMTFLMISAASVGASSPTHTTYWSGRTRINGDPYASLSPSYVSRTTCNGTRSEFAACSKARTA